MPNLRPRSAGVTAAATLALLGSASALFVWAYFFVALLNLPADSNGKHAYEAFPFFFLMTATVPPLLIGLGLRMGIGLFQLRPWARVAALVWAAVALLFCLAMIAFRPFETFFFPDHFVSELQSFKQLLAIAFLIMLMPISIWWLFFFRTRSVKLQFLPPDSQVPAEGIAAAGKI
jgi:hypothetical protein